MGWPRRSLVATGRRGGGRGASALPFSPAHLASILAAIDLNLRAPTPGAGIATCPALVGPDATVTGTTRVFSLTNLVASDGSTHPSLQLVDARMAWPIGSLLTGLTSLWVILGYRDYLAISAHDRVLLEFGTPNFLGDGRFAIGRNIGAGAGSFSALAQGGGGWAVWVSTDYEVPEFPGVIAVRFDLASAPHGQTARRVDNVAADGANGGGNAVVAGSTWDASQALYIGGRDGGGADVPLLLNTAIILRGTASESDVTEAIRYAASKMGEVAA